jgi:hypothetical protein
MCCTNKIHGSDIHKNSIHAELLLCIKVQMMELADFNLKRKNN